MSNLRTIDLTPSPRVLKMLGQVDFKPWQCLAELIDNSVDAFLSAGGNDTGVLFPQVTIELPDNSAINHGSAEIRVTDNGPGMSLDDLENAVTAGYSSNNPVDKLGLFGMGFNVATARLGQRTEVWTSKMEDDTWSGVAIDFDEIISTGFQVPALSRPKTPAEHGAHGTRVIISRLNQGIAKYLRTGMGGLATRAKLGRIYNKVMRDTGLVVVVGGTELESKDFCTWDKSRYVETTGWAGKVPAYTSIAVDFGSGFYCSACWVWLEKDETVCPSCEMTDNLSERERVLTGWIGIQRYFDKDDFGIDLVRNGRIIEERSKSFFSWEGQDGTVVPEYPIDTTHWGGRIVGELDLGFVPLASHQKDAFDHSSNEWGLIYQAIHGDGPVLPDIRKRLDFNSDNHSPLARLHVAYRRGNPAGRRWLVPGNVSDGKGFNAEAQQWASLFWKGDKEYQSDEKWWKAVLQVEEARNSDTDPIPDNLSGDDLLPGGKPEENGSGSMREEVSVERSTQEAEDPSMSGEFTVDGIPSCPTLNVLTSRVTTGRLRSGMHMEFATVSNRVVATYDPAHELFTDSLVEPVDCLVQELAYQFLQRTQVVQAEWGISRISNTLKSKYFNWSMETVDSAENKATAFINDLRSSVAEIDVVDLPSAKNELTDAILEEISENVMRKTREGKARVDSVLESGEYVSYLGESSLVKFVVQFPDLVGDGKFFTIAIEDANDIARKNNVDSMNSYLQDVLSLANGDLGGLGRAERKAKLARGLASLNLLDAWRA
jgi:hypothetical protein